jgi:hypothetical protein
MKHLVVFLLITVAVTSAHGDETYPAFSEAYWARERDLAVGKMWRGAGLTALGAASFVPAAILISKSVDNPHKYLAWSAVVSIAAIGMTGHGIGSLVFGRSQLDRAEKFVDQYQTDSAAVDAQRERDAYIHDRKTTTTKVILFGSVISLQGAVLVGNGILLSVNRSRGESIGGATIWPSYVVGGLLLAGGTVIIIVNTMRYRDLDALLSQPVQVSRHVSVSPYYDVDPARGGHNFGLSGTLSF